jgi:tRNA(Ile)-lysidine synthase
MIRILGTIPHKVNLAFSGGVDSLAVAHFLKAGGRDVTLLHFNHGCEYSDKIEDECLDASIKLSLPIIFSDSIVSKPPEMSLEEFWRVERYKFLRRTSGSVPVITCHHLDDAVETWVWSSLHGTPKLIPYENVGIIRPFLITPKDELIAYANRHGLTPVDDPYNRETHLIRNYIRCNIMPHAYYVNPGLKKVIKKKYLR